MHKQKIKKSSILTSRLKKRCRKLSFLVYEQRKLFQTNWYITIKYEFSKILVYITFQWARVLVVSGSWCKQTPLKTYLLRYECSLNINTTNNYELKSGIFHEKENAESQNETKSNYLKTKWKIMSYWISFLNNFKHWYHSKTIHILVICPFREWDA